MASMPDDEIEEPAERVTRSRYSDNTLILMLKAGKFVALDAQLELAQAQYRKGLINDIDLANLYTPFQDEDEALQSHYDAWIETQPASYSAFLARGIYFYSRGLTARGSKFIDETSKEQVERMSALLQKAAADINRSLSLEAKPIVSLSYLIHILRYAGGNARTVLNRSLQVDPHNRIARNSYLFSLQTRWGGSPELMRAFAQECRQAELSQDYTNAVLAFAAFDEAWTLYMDKDYMQAVPHYQRALDLVSPEYKRMVSNRFYRGQLLNAAYAHQQAKHPEKTIRFINTALLEGESGRYAYLRRGFAYYALGKKKEAADDYLRAARMGNAWAQNALGAMMVLGDGIPVNVDEGIRWLEHSSQRGNQDAKKNLYWARKKYKKAP